MKIIDSGVVYVEITDSAGRRRPEYDMDVLLTDGNGSHAFTLASNDPPGSWRAKLEDVATGMVGRTEFVIKSPSSSASGPEAR